MQSPTMPTPTTDIPITPPALKATFKPSFKLVWAAVAVLQLARTAIFMPMKPAPAEQIAPNMKARLTHHPSAGISPRTMAMTTAKIARFLYSRVRNAVAPSLIAPDISLIRSVPSPLFKTLKARNPAKSNPMTPIMIAIITGSIGSSFLNYFWTKIKELIRCYQLLFAYDKTVSPCVRNSSI